MVLRYEKSMPQFISHLLSSLALLCLSFVAVESMASTFSESNVTVIKRALTVYPQYAVKNGIEGAVLLSYSIEKDGNVSDIKVEASDQLGLFDASAILALQRWGYTQPAKKRNNNYVAIEFALTKYPKVSSFSHVEIIRVKASNL